MIRLRDGRQGLAEVELGGDSLVEQGAKSLRRLAGKIDESAMGKPSFLMVITAIGGYSYPREDGVIICPITCLGV